MNKKAGAVGLVIVCIMAAQVVAAEGIVGEWEFKSHFDPMSWSATMTITKNAEGKFAGTWSADFGESTLSDITFEGGVLKLVQTSDFGGQQMKTTYEGTVEGTKIKGKGNNQFGDLTFEGQAQSGVDGIVGTWQISMSVPAREIVEKMTVTKNVDGSLAGKWTAQRGENTISNVKFEGGKLTFTRTGKMGPMDFTTDYEGTVEGDSIKGVFHSDFGDRESNATRVNAAEPNKPEPNKPDTAKPKQ